MAADAQLAVDHLREASGGVPIGVKMSAQHVEADLDVALDLGVDYVILDGRGGGTGAAPTILRDNISVPMMAGLARARRRMDERGVGRDVTLIATGGLRRPADIVKALALGADAVAVSNTALQAIGCVGMRACHTDNCPVGIATQKPHLRARLPVERAAEQLSTYLTSAVELMTVLARACGHHSLSDFTSRRPHVVAARGRRPGRDLLRRGRRWAAMSESAVRRPGTGSATPTSRTRAGSARRSSTAGRSRCPAAPVRWARWRTAARTRAARSARGRSRTAGCAAPGTATTTTRRPASRPRASPTRRRRTGSRSGPTAPTSSCPTCPTTSARSVTSWSRPSSRGASPRSSAWSATRISVWQRRCGGPRSAAS